MTKQSIKLLREGNYAAEVLVELQYTKDDWSPTMSASDARRLDNVRLALRRGDLVEAAKQGRVYELTPVAVK